MKKTVFLLLISMSFAANIFCQNIPQNISYTRIYEFVDELANEGIFEVNSAIKPYSRDFIARKLREASDNEELLNRRQVEELHFFMQDYALELDTLPEAKLSLIRNENVSLALLQPAFMYRDRLFKARITPILGMDIVGNSKGIITEQRWGAEIQADIANHISVWGSMRELRFDGSRLSGNVFKNKQLGALLYPSKVLLGADRTRPFGYETDFLYNHLGYQYDLNNHYGGDFAEVRAGIRFYMPWGSLGLVKDNIVWGDNFNGSNIISGRAPSFPMITLNLKPCNWFELNYIHGWLVSNVTDSANYYQENEIRHYRMQSKYIAANMLTFRPIPKLDLSIGNSIIYAEQSINPLYLIPIAFYKAFDKGATRGLAIENQNSQIFVNFSSRNIKHLHLYFSAFIDEVSFRRFLPSSAEKNPISYKIGANITNFPLQNFAFTAELTRTNIITYKHSIEALTWENNSIGLGHYLGDNAMDIYLAVKYMPIRGLDLKLSYTGIYKYNDYNFVREHTKTIISQKPYNQKVFSNSIVAFRALYEVFNNIYAHIDIQYNNAQGYDLSANAGKVEGENTLTAEQNLNKFSPLFYQGKNVTATVGLNFNF